MSLKIHDINDCDPDHAIIVPALYINGTLYAYGEFDISKLNRFINNNLN
ncbi:MAG: hypothetical protein JEY94_07590 [Melioribacteraceae bacterium]|nr:hypothetical protein [Melioribacteraceae bacterium]